MGLIMINKDDDNDKKTYVIRGIRTHTLSHSSSLRHGVPPGLCVLEDRHIQVWHFPDWILQCLYVCSTSE